jgi:ATP-dependent protease HslVU (ClpYQ) peptidase subunit
MTIIAAYDDGATIALASDSCGICGITKVDLGSKIIKKSNYHLGFADSYRIRDIIKESKQLPRRIDKREDLRELRDILREELISKMSSVRADEGDDEIISTHPLDILIISQFGVCEIQNNYAILKPKDNFTAIGAGSDIAIGAMATHKLYGAEAPIAVKEAIKTTLKYCTQCGGRIYLATIKREK